MNWILDLLALTLCLAFGSGGVWTAADLWFQRFKQLRGSTALLVSGVTLLGCLAVAACIHEPEPRVHDEFSYQLMGETLAAGHLSNPTPALPEFFETFHVLVRPAYASKYFPGQGLFLAFGERLMGHPAVGVWLSSALACAAITWMLQAWIGTGWAIVGGFLMIVQYGVFSYWSQAYWGGMVAALGGALFFGALRRRWDRIALPDALSLSLGLVLLANSRPLEGVLASLPASGLFLYRVWSTSQWREARFWFAFVLPSFVLLSCAALAMGAYNRAITGSP